MYSLLKGICKDSHYICVCVKVKKNVIRKVINIYIYIK